MLKKVLPLALMSGLALGACGYKGAIPPNNETPMDNTNYRQNWTPNVNRDETGPNFDGYDDGRNVDGVRDGTINNTNPYNNNRIQDRTPRDTIIDNNLDRNNINR